MATSKQTISTNVSFAPAAAQIVAAQRAADKAQEKAGKTVEKVMLFFLDQCKNLPRNKEGCDVIGKAMAAELKPEGVLGKAIKEGVGLKRESLKQYVTSAKIAHFKNIPWKAGLFNEKLPYNPDGTLKAAPAKESSNSVEPAKAAGKVQTTTMKDLEQTIRKAIEQARLLNQRELANLIGALAADRLDGFKFESKSE